MTKEIPACFTLQTVINNYHEWLDSLDRIENVDDLIDTVWDFIKEKCPEIDTDFHLSNILIYFDNESFEELDDKFVSSNQDDVSIDDKIEIIDDCIILLLTPPELLDGGTCMCMDEDDEDILLMVLIKKSK